MLALTLAMALLVGVSAQEGSGSGSGVEPEPVMCEQAVFPATSNKVVVGGACPDSNLGSVCPVMCADGHEPTDLSAGLMYEVVCGADGLWTETEPFSCQAIARPKIETAEGGMTLHTGRGKDVTFQLGPAEGGVTMSVRGIQAKFGLVDQAAAQTAASLAQLEVDTTTNITDLETATVIETTGIRRDVGQLRSDVDTLDDELVQLLTDHNALDNDHEVTKGAATVLQGEVDALKLAVPAETAARTSAISGVMAGQQAAIASSEQRTRAYCDAKINNILNHFDLLEQCIADGGNFDPNAAVCVILLGTAPKNPANSCKQLLGTAHGKVDGTYFIKHGNAIVETFCLQSEDGGGWELLMSLSAASSTWGYDSNLWTSATTTLNDKSFTNVFGQDRKFHNFNVGIYKDLKTKWNRPDNGAKWEWPQPSGYGTTNPATTQKYFTTSRTLRNGRSSVLASPEFRTNHFSGQGCAARLSIAQCTSGSACTRWGFHWNNECGFGSNDAGGGLGTRPRAQARAAGDWVTCCCNPCRDRKSFDVMMFGRKA